MDFGSHRNNKQGKQTVGTHAILKLSNIVLLFLHGKYVWKTDGRARAYAGWKVHWPKKTVVANESATAESFSG